MYVLLARRRILCALNKMEQLLAQIKELHESAQTELENLREEKMRLEEENNRLRLVNAQLQTDILDMEVSLVLEGYATD